MKLRPFEASLQEDVTMYDKLPYQKDIDLCGPDKIAMQSGNIVKFYRCQSKEIYQLNGMDDLFYEKLSLHEEQKLKKAEDTEKNSIEKLADTLLPENTIETVENPVLAEEETASGEAVVSKETATETAALETGN